MSSSSFFMALPDQGIPGQFDSSTEVKAFPRHKTAGIEQDDIPRRAGFSPERFCAGFRVLGRCSSWTAPGRTVCKPTPPPNLVLFDAPSFQAEKEVFPVMLISSPWSAPWTTRQPSP